jgi:hypothetical protein
MTKKKAAKRPAKKAEKKVKRQPRPRTQRLPGMEDSGIQELESLANDMADIIADKKKMTAEEKNLNEQLVAAMKKYGKTSYSHRGIHINLSQSEKAKVVIKDEDEDDTPADPGEAPAPKVNSESLAVSAEA